MDKMLELYRKQDIELKGKRIKCLEMKDVDPIVSGSLGTVEYVDDMGTIHVKWDNGRTLGIVPSEDKFEFLT
jgi:hypothetical protein